MNLLSLRNFFFLILFKTQIMIIKSRFLILLLIIIYILFNKCKIKKEFEIIHVVLINIDNKSLFDNMKIYLNDINK